MFLKSLFKSKHKRILELEVLVEQLMCENVTYRATIHRMNGHVAELSKIVKDMAAGSKK